MSKTAWSRLTPERAAEAAGERLEDIKRRSLAAYLIADNKRRSLGFEHLWRRWTAGQSHMPLCVEVVLTHPEYNASLDSEYIQNQIAERVAKEKS